MNRVRVIVRRDANESQRTTVFEAGAPIGARVVPLPQLVACAWDAVGGQPETVRRTVVQIGTALRGALSEPRTIWQLTRVDIEGHLGSRALDQPLYDIAIVPKDSLTEQVGELTSELLEQVRIGLRARFDL